MTYYNDADIEMRELAERAAEDEAETCRACGTMYESETLFVSHSPRHVEMYRCDCGHVTGWINHRRVS